MSKVEGLFILNHCGKGSLSLQIIGANGCTLLLSIQHESDVVGLAITFMPTLGLMHVWVTHVKCTSFSTLHPISALQDCSYLMWVCELEHIVVVCAIPAAPHHVDIHLHATKEQVNHALQYAHNQRMQAWPCRVVVQR